MAIDLRKKTDAERRKEVEKQLEAAGYKPCGENRYSRVERSGKVYEICLDEHGQIWTY